jgi:two-component system response regulator AtoC
MKKILIIEKECSTREQLTQLFQKKSMHLSVVEDSAGALELLKKGSFDLIFSDLKGIRSLERIGRRPSHGSVVFLKGVNEKNPGLVDAILEKPVKAHQFEEIFHFFKSKERMKSSIIAESRVMKEILKRVKKGAKSDANILICGESGTGKEVIASLIHEESKRALSAFIRVNCAALPDALIESEFFGHEKGAFTGAHTKRIGRFELANQGTLLLDEISEIPTTLQVKLLRAIQEQEFERVGGVESIPVDVRLIATSNRNMQEAIQEGVFREDLYYRLNVIPVFLPPLRERPEDILPLASHFLKEISLKNKIGEKPFSPKAENKLISYDWPGNIRQLRNVIEYAVIMSEGEEICHESLLSEEERLGKKISKVGLSLEEVEKQHILETLRSCQENRTQAAAKLGITVRTLRNKLKTYTI